MTAVLNVDPTKADVQPVGLIPPDYAKTYANAEKKLIQLITVDALDQQISANPELTKTIDQAIATALQLAYSSDTLLKEHDAAHLFLQRVLYHINRLNLFWYDNLNHYQNERSLYLQSVRDRIEAPWQEWELAQVDIAQMQRCDVEKALIARAEVDLDPVVTENKRYLREEMSLEGYRWLLAIASVDGLVEASRLSRILGGASNEVQATLIRVLLEEYGNGRLTRKHSTFFAQMMRELDLNTQPEGYLNWVPWEVLATINHNFLLTERKRHFLRYNGGLTYFEIAGPSIYTDYMMAAQRLGLSDSAMGYWELHIREDERHGRWMLDDVALPLADRYPNDAWELVLGYDQEKCMGDRAGAAVIQIIRAMESHAPLPRLVSHQ